MTKAKTLDEILAALKIKHWDYVIVGDGSCTGNWKYEGGWAAVTIDEATRTSDITHGATDRSTNVVAELMAYVWALVKLTESKDLGAGPYSVHILTDCEVLSKTGNREYLVKKNRSLWLLVESFKRYGIMITWHWVPRETFNLNRLCHTLANLARVGVQNLQQKALREVFNRHPSKKGHGKAAKQNRKPKKKAVAA